MMMRMMKMMMMKRKKKRTRPSHPPSRRTTVRKTTARKALSLITIRAIRSLITTSTLMRLKVTLFSNLIIHPLSITKTDLSRTMLTKATLLCIRPTIRAITTTWCLLSSSRSLSQTTTMARSSKDLEFRLINITTEGTDLTSMTRTRSRGWGLQSTNSYLSRRSLPTTGLIRTSRWVPTNLSPPRKCIPSTLPTMGASVQVRSHRLPHVNPHKLY